MRTNTQQTIAEILLVLAMAFTFNACSGDDNGSDGGDPSISSSSTGTGNSSSSYSSGTDVSSSGGNVAQEQCGTDKWYSMATHFCSNDAIYEKCGGREYNPSLQNCDNGTLKNNNNNNIGSITDSRDGKTYKTVVIGNQTWLAENLNYNAMNIGVCYYNDPANCEKYGRLYNWSTAMNLSSSCESSDCSSQVQAKHRGICPTGWHLPNNAEWTTLISHAGGKAGKKLKAASGWNGGGNGTDEYGFKALPGGWYEFGGFSELGEYGIWWSSTQRNLYDAYSWDVYAYDDESLIDEIRKDFLLSIRCVKD